MLRRYMLGMGGCLASLPRASGPAAAVLFGSLVSSCGGDKLPVIGAPSPPMQTVQVHTGLTPEAAPPHGFTKHAKPRPHNRGSERMPAPNAAGRFS